MLVELFLLVYNWLPTITWLNFTAFNPQLITFWCATLVDTDKYRANYYSNYNRPISMCIMHQLMQLRGLFVHVVIVVDWNASWTHEVYDVVLQLVFRSQTFIFTVQREMQTRSSDENSVRPSVRPSDCLSVKRVHCDKTEEKSVQIFTLYERSFSLACWEEEWSLGATSIWKFGSTGPRLSEIADFEQIIAHSASAVTPSEKVQLPLIGSPVRAFQWAKDEHRTLSLSPQRVAQKRSVQNLNNKLRWLRNGTR